MITRTHWFNNWVSINRNCLIFWIPPFYHKKAFLIDEYLGQWNRMWISSSISLIKFVVAVDIIFNRGGHWLNLMQTSVKLEISKSCTFAIYLKVCLENLANSLILRCSFTELSMTFLPDWFLMENYCGKGIEWPVEKLPVTVDTWANIIYFGILHGMWCLPSLALVVFQVASTILYSFAT